MKALQARQKKNPDGTPSGIWHFTYMSPDGDISAVGYCLHLKCDHHSAEEAIKCYSNYILDFANKETSRKAHKKSQHGNAGRSL